MLVPGPAFACVLGSAAWLGCCLQPLRRNDGPKEESPEPGVSGAQGGRGRGGDAAVAVAVAVAVGVGEGE